MQGADYFCSISNTFVDGNFFLMHDSALPTGHLDDQRLMKCIRGAHFGLQGTQVMITPTLDQFRSD